MTTSSTPRVNARYRCPDCGSRATVRIIYGIPDPGLFEAVEAGRVKLGGCLIGDTMPTRHCTGCGHEWVLG